MFYLVLRALDTVGECHASNINLVFMLPAANILYFFFFGTTEDDTSIPTDEKLPILIAFHRHIYNTDWHYSCKFIESFNLLSFICY